MDPSTGLDYAMFQLSPRRSRCELFISGNRITEKLASGLLKPFITHLKVVEEKAGQQAKSIKLEVDRRRSNVTWFNKGTLERFVRFVSTPEVLELASTFDAEMSQLEGARRIYLQGAGDALTATSGESGSASSAAADTTKKELLRAIDLRLIAIKQDLAMACARASSAGFTPENVSELLQFADHFGAIRLSEVCTKFIALCQRRPELSNHQHQTQSVPRQLNSLGDVSVQSSYSSDMSIDDISELEVASSNVYKPTDFNLQLHKLSTPQTQQLNAPELVNSELPEPVQQGAVEKQNVKTIDNPAPSATSTELAEQSGGSSRRLSVQDRINLFESKRKEQSASSNAATGAGSLSRAPSGKGELRRFPSDVSEKSVLKRWSGASDMSIDLSSGPNDKKESKSAASTPTSANMLLQSSSRSTEDEAAVSQDTVTSQLLLDPKEIGGPTLSLSQGQSKSFPKDKTSAQNEGTKYSVSLSKPTHDKQGNYQMSASLCDPDASKVNSEGTAAGLKYQLEKNAEPKSTKVKDLAALQPSSSFVSTVNEQVEWRDRESFRQSRGTSPVVDDDRSKDEPPLVAQFSTFVRKTDYEAKGKGSSDSQIQLKVSSLSDFQSSQVQRQMSPGELEDAWERSATASQEPYGAAVKTKANYSTYWDMDIHGQPSAPDLLKKPQGRKGGGGAEIESKPPPVVPVRKMKGTKEITDPSSTASLEQVHVMRQSKGNQELNDELQIKANELEKLFAAHKLRIQNEQPASSYKLRIHNEQSASSRRSKSSGVQEGNVPNAMDTKHTAVPELLNKNASVDSSNSNLDFDNNLLQKMVDREYNYNLNIKLGSFWPSDDIKGKLYDKYMHKRNAKLQEEWGSKRTQKEAKMKEMLDSLESSQAELKAKFAGSDGQDSRSSRRIAENLKSRTRSGLKNKDQLSDDSFKGDKDDLKKMYEQVDCSGITSYDVLFDDRSRKSDSKNLSSSKSLSSSIPRVPVTAVPKPSTRSANAMSIKRKNPVENPHAESVPNFSDSRKENTKSSAATSRFQTRTATRNFSGNKSRNEENDMVKVPRPHRSQINKKSTNVQGHLKDWSSPDFVGTDLETPRLSSKEKSDPVFKSHKTQEPKLLHRKRYSTPGLTAGTDKAKKIMVSEVNKTEEDYEVEISNGEDIAGPFIDEEEIERDSAEENVETIDFFIDSDSEKARHSQEFRNSDDPGSENGDAERSLSPADYDTAPASPKPTTSAGIVQESPGESPRSWNHHIDHSFSYAHETSDVDAYVDSPVGSPGSWNFHPLNQMMEADAARMRKKWGNAQIPVLVSNASQQPRKDVTKGFKRLLKFGRKPRGVESLASDWVSASTASEGDDETEDGRDLTIRPSDDLRKSRMGYSLPPDDAFNEDENFPEQGQNLRSSIPVPQANFKLREEHLTGSSMKAPRSFFSLSAFRSKGSESKLR